jgi:hypothetical protein
MIEIARWQRRRRHALRSPAVLAAALALLGTLIVSGTAAGRFAAAAALILVAAFALRASQPHPRVWPQRPLPFAPLMFRCSPLPRTFTARFWLVSEHLRTAQPPCRTLPIWTSTRDGRLPALDDLIVRFGRRGANRYEMALRMSPTAWGAAVMLFKDLAEDKDALEWLRYNAVRRIADRDPDLAAELLRSMTYQLGDPIVRLHACDRLADHAGEAGRTAYRYLAIDSQADPACRREAILELAAADPRAAESTILRYVRDERLPHAERFGLAEQLLGVDQALGVTVLLVMAELWFDPLEQRIPVAALLMQFGQPCGRDKLLNCAMNASVAPELRLMAMGFLNE